MERTYIVTPDVQLLINTLREVMKNQTKVEVQRQTLAALTQPGDVKMLVDFLELFES